MVRATTPKVSVIMAVYNGAPYLVEAIDSILHQTLTDLELIVVDDASTDATPHILEQYNDPRVRVIHNLQNLGAYGAANVGLALAQGDYVARQDADDISLPDRLAKQLHYMSIHPALSLLGTSYSLIDYQGRTLDYSLLPTDDETLREALASGNTFCHGTIMVQRTLLKHIGGYCSTFPVSQDYDLILRLSELGQIANLPEPLYQFRFHSNSLSRDKRANQLAHRRFAWARAEQRRRGAVELPLPEDIVTAYPPEPEKLWHEARSSVYLYYASGRLDLATQAIVREREIYPELHDTPMPWIEWALGRASLLAKLRQDAGQGAAFLIWLARELHSRGIEFPKREVLCRYYTSQAFLAYRNRSGKDVLQHTFSAIYRHPRAGLNRGLWSIFLRSLARQTSGRTS